ncbi:hypothetical protein RBRH_01467 [Mycetohabitans rhizoxinica HKI 454]|uniref:Uncharacterized protein n=2 Tax=Mycetohabitans rhizoxinica TaxID=412963 RepID=E5AKR5_MYCRK|nr:MULTISPECIES: hypothetical protein [Mycetohabitans]MCF7696442.1 hypothetical protein [Mycetohabitans sp. B2]MCG1047777.1 hypothetical protein [Mycetohabitans sp. B6]CBK52864.1 hypothetical protein [Mycetohabitans rhizoxinica HKI 454]CBW75872.1 hypothetical protein RBRH_01467 [Mycetohabitans rhizoxinica HKI 454]
MTDARRVWILDYLSIFRDSTVSATGFVSDTITCNDEGTRLIERARQGSWVIGHEIPSRLAAVLTAHEVTYVDIRVSPFRFLAHDFILAMRTNCPRIFKHILPFRILDAHLKFSAKSLELSFRYRNLGQHSIPENSAVVLTDQHPNRQYPLRCSVRA